MDFTVEEGSGPLRLHVEQVTPPKDQDTANARIVRTDDESVALKLRLGEGSADVDLSLSAGDYRLDVDEGATLAGLDVRTRPEPERAPDPRAALRAEIDAASTPEAALAALKKLADHLLA